MGHRQNYTAEHAKIRVLAVLGIFLDISILILELTMIMPGNYMKNAGDVVTLVLLCWLFARPEKIWLFALITIEEGIVNIVYGGHILGLLFYTFGLAILLKSGFFRSRGLLKVSILIFVILALTLSQIWTLSLKRFIISIVNISLASALIFGFLYLFHDALRGFYQEKPTLNLSECGFTPRQFSCVRGCLASERIKDLAQKLIVSESVVKKELIVVYERLGVSDYRELKFKLENSNVRYPKGFNRVRTLNRPSLLCNPAEWRYKALRPRERLLGLR